MAKEIDSKLVTKLAGIVKKNPGNSETFYSEQSGVPKSQILRYLVLAEIEADPSLKFKASGASIKKAREAGVRWPRIAARTGLSESAVKDMFESHTGTSARESYTGRGRNFSGTAPAAGKSGTSGRRSGVKVTETKKGASGRRGASAKATVAGGGTRRGAAPAGRRGTRASAADPK